MSSREIKTLTDDLDRLTVAVAIDPKVASLLNSNFPNDRGELLPELLSKQERRSL